jgi:hypothetical protein
MSIRKKSLDLPGQGIGPALSTQQFFSRFKSFFISKNCKLDSSDVLKYLT